MQMQRVTVMAHFPGDGGDPIEASARLPFVPRENDDLCVWITGANGSTGHDEYLTVAKVIVSTYDPEQIIAWISTDGHTPDEMARIFQAIEEHDLP